jgi:signal transduction histidine kinase
MAAALRLVAYVVAEQPEEAARALSSIERISCGALREMRALLGVLRSDAPAAGSGPAGDGGGPASPGRAGLVPAPGLGDLDRLAARTAEVGVRVDLDVRVERPTLPAGLDLAAYRVIQEAITNVIKHAAADRCRVAVAYQADALTLEITDSGNGARASGLGSQAAAHDSQAAGHGLAGMRERVGMYGGEFRAAPRPEGGFRVTAWFPLEGTAA